MWTTSAAARAGAAAFVAVARFAPALFRMRRLALSPAASLGYSPAMQAYLLVFIGAGLGGVLRHVLNLTIGRAMGTDFPWATLFINISGSLVMGLFVGWLAFRAGGGWTQHGRLFFATGVLGGYTTFSTFSLETILLIERNQIGSALAYVGGSVIVGVLALWGGLALARSFS